MIKGNSLEDKVAKNWQNPGNFQMKSLLLGKKECLTGPICFPGEYLSPVTSPSQFLYFVLKGKKHDFGEGPKY